MTELTPADGSAAQREARLAALRSRVRALEDECLVLRAGLPGADTWRGVASAAYRGQLARLRSDVERALSWLASARGEL
jgi:uncharacterized protein YukE